MVEESFTFKLLIMWLSDSESLEVEFLFEGWIDIMDGEKVSIRSPSEVMRLPLTNLRSF